MQQYQYGIAPVLAHTDTAFYVLVMLMFETVGVRRVAKAFLMSSAKSETPTSTSTTSMGHRKAEVIDVLHGFFCSCWESPGALARE